MSSSRSDDTYSDDSSDLTYDSSSDNDNDDVEKTVKEKPHWVDLFEKLSECASEDEFDKIWDNRYARTFPNGYQIYPDTSRGDARTLSCWAVSHKEKSGWSIARHEDWIVAGRVHEDYFYWVNSFYAVHRKYGRVFGNFEDYVYADTSKGYNNFIEEFPVKAWDYADI